ncbi:MAG: hypothetical protein R6U57_01900 [Anaerolineales bacterium]
MSEEKKYTLEEAHLAFAKQMNGRVWELLGASPRSEAEDLEMVHAAHASLSHWLHVGTPVHHQRGEWLISRVYTVLGYKDAALRHAKRCLDLTETHEEIMEDFDLAYAYEGMARALALSGSKEEAEEFKERAQQAGEEIGDHEDQSLFFSDLEGGPWYVLE